MQVSISLTAEDSSTSTLLLKDRDNPVGRGKKQSKNPFFSHLPNLSREHAVITVDPELRLTFFRPLSKTNACYKDGKELVVNEAIVVQDGDVIK
jgi:hypothetical protein